MINKFLNLVYLYIVSNHRNIQKKLLYKQRNFLAFIESLLEISFPYTFLYAVSLHLG